MYCVKILYKSLAKRVHLTLKSRKGIILAGGNGTRLYPITKAVSKQLMPIYDKPMIYYPLSTLMLSGIREILIITNPKDKEGFQDLLGNGKQLGLDIQYAEQLKANGIAEAFLISESFLNGSMSALALGDNIFHGNDLSTKLHKNAQIEEGASIFAYRVNDPKRYGIIEFDKQSKVLNIIEKPIHPKSNYAVTGLYFHDETAVERVKELKPSKRGELEITDLNLQYLKEDKLNAEVLGRGMVWLDTGTHDSLHEASSYIRTLEHRQGLKICCPEEVAWNLGWINNDELELLATGLINSSYGKYLLRLIKE